MKKLTYPNVECAKHQKTEPGYMVCVHVQQGEPPFHVQLASKESLGVVHCARIKKHTLDELNLCCASCARERGWLLNN